MKRLWNNIRTLDDIMNTILTSVVFTIVKTSNGIQYIKMGVYKIRGVKCYMFHDHKFGEKYCYRLKDNEK